MQVYFINILTTMFILQFPKIKVVYGWILSHHYFMETNNKLVEL